MLQFKGKSNKIGRFSAIYFVFLPLFIISCTGTGSVSDERRTMITSTDSLWAEMASIKKMFGYKTEELSERRHFMDSILQHYRFVEGSNISKEDQSMVSQYNSIRRVYKDFGPRYTECVVEAEELYFEIKTLDKQVKSGKLDGKLSEFGKEYRSIRAKLAALRTELEEVTGRVNSVEPTYQRIAPKVEELLEKIKP